MAARRPGPGDFTARPAAGPGRRGGLVTMTLPLPRFVYTKVLATGATAFYWHVTKHYRRLGCTIPEEPLGTDYATACGTDGLGGRAAALNGLFNEWRQMRDG